MTGPNNTADDIEWSRHYAAQEEDMQVSLGQRAVEYLRDSSFPPFRLLAVLGAFAYGVAQDSSDKLHDEAAKLKDTLLKQG